MAKQTQTVEMVRVTAPDGFSMEIPKWQLHKDHDDDWRAVLKNTGCLDDKGQLRRWNGKEVWPLITEMGHDHGEFLSCCCSRCDRPVVDQTVV